MSGSTRTSTRDRDRQAVGVVLICASCARIYRPTAADFAAGRISCPDPDCNGWIFWAQQLRPNDDHSAIAERDGG